MQQFKTPYTRMFLECVIIWWCDGSLDTKDQCGAFCRDMKTNQWLVAGILHWWDTRLKIVIKIDSIHIVKYLKFSDFFDSFILDVSSLYWSLVNMLHVTFHVLRFQVGFDRNGKYQAMRVELYLDAGRTLDLTAFVRFPILFTKRNPFKRIMTQCTYQPVPIRV